MKIDDYSLQIKMSKQAQQRINECLLKMITKDLQPLSIVENKGFQEYTAALNSTYILPSRNTISKSLLPKAYENRLLDVKNSLETIENICITTDGWTSIANESYISLTGHFICHEWKQRSVFLSCFKTAKDHTANNLKDDICAALQEWNLDSKIACVLSDNAANIVAAIRKTGWTHLPCLAHTLHLVVMDALKSDGINEIIIKCKAVAEYFCHSTKACNKLKEIQKQMGKSNLKLINSMPTRWNSTLKMLERIVDNQEPLEATVAILHNPVQLFSLDEWETIRDIIGILQPFNEVTIEMSGETYTTISKVLVLTHGLQTFLLKKQSLQKNEKCCNMLEKLAANIKRRFHGSEFNEVYAISSFLDPRFKTKSFSDECALQICESKINMILENISTNHDIVLDVLLEKNLNEGSIWVEFDKNAIVSKNTTQKSFTEMEQYKNEAILERTKCPLEW